jgi:uncharacterized protein (DUF2141 family)
VILAAILTSAIPLTTQASAGAHVTVTVRDLRSGRGQVLACLTTQPKAFPDCSHDPLSHKLKVPAAHVVELDFGAVPQGNYAISLVHDENGNGKMDTRLMLPREGYGFSRNAPVRMGPPKFASAAFDVGGTAEHLDIRMRYML